MPRILRVSLSLLLVSYWLGLNSVQASDAIDTAKSFIAKGDPYNAVDCLESAIPEATEQRLPVILEMLRSAYESAASKADSEGKTREANHYREGRKLLESPKVAEKPETEPRPIEEPKAPETKTEPDAEPAQSSVPNLGYEDMLKADACWKAKKYLEAGEIYAELAKAGKLPPTRHDHWAYCRLVAVLEKINNGPKTPAEWAEVHAEIDHIRVLAPKNWYGEYLRNIVVERSGGVRKAKPDKVVVRGAAPDETLAPAKPARTRTPAKAAPRELPRDPAPLSAPEPKPQPAPANVPDPETTIGRAGPPQGNWQTFMTANFRIFHNDEALARKAAVRAEAARRSATKFWTGADPAAPWTPKCDLYLYPTAAVFSSQTQQPPESPGFSTAGLEGGRVTARLVKLRADYAKMLDAVLPHEITHIVLADLFPTRQIPRWADEGMAVLSEPAAEQALRARDLAKPVADDVLFRLNVLMTADYPGGKHWSLYYAQSVSLTRYLAGLGTPQQFVEFVHATQDQGIDTALRKTYNIENVATLETRWKAHARQTLNPATASSDVTEPIRR